MVYSDAASAIQTYSIKVLSNTIATSFRKGITTFSNLSLYDLLISGNTVTGSGLGNIYIGGDAGSTHDKIRVVGNYCASSPVNIQIGSTSNSVVDGNNCDNNSGSSNIGFVNSTDLVISNNVVQNSAVHGITFIAAAGQRNEQIAIIGNIVRNSNRTTAGFGAGIRIDDTDVALVASNIVVDDAATIRQTHGIDHGQRCLECNNGSISDPNDHGNGVCNQSRNDV
jgi:hypothetical protein